MAPGSPGLTTDGKRFAIIDLEEVAVPETALQSVAAIVFYAIVLFHSPCSPNILPPVFYFRSCD